MSTPASGKAPQPAEVLMQFAAGYIVSAALYTVTKLGIPDLLKTGPKAAEKLAREAGANEDAVYRALRALSGIGVFSEVMARTFALTPVGELLCAGTPGSLREMILWWDDPMHFQVYPAMEHALKTGETVIEKVFGLSCWDYLAKHKEVSDHFNGAMTNFSAMTVPAVLEAYDFSWLNGGVLVDIAGGHGYLLAEVLRKYPQVQGKLFDLEHVLEGAQPRLAAAGFNGRCQMVSGDFFESVPDGNGYVLKHIIHDWNDEKALAILKNIHRASSGKARVIVVDAVLEPGNEPHLAKWLDLEMLMLPGGRERTQEEFGKLFEKAGFKLTRVIRTKSPVCVIEAEKVQ
jgi:O-methyltransferase/methyltransferase family protein